LNLERAASGLSRRRFLGGLVLLLSATLARLGGALAQHRRQHAGSRRVALAEPSVDGVFFHQEVILVRRGDAVRALSARCPHLGCFVNQSDRGQLVCPCHGSRFDLEGTRVQGPANAGLSALPLQRDAASGSVTVELPG